ncbi:2-hydroxyacid dehydrogenase [Priestia filamentosa]|uniref:D-glycerate dehydrogenase n=1 Tax=Priestia filamentosa TaxID=1402861 RepID=A0A1X7GEB3_9BACI|nr:D-glycerate dehydrogenase [Priestia filamentosa]AKO90890.1 D-glycerate dehydrogenase [Priestia filamentosa]MDT3766021.1 D-glycerate dehydrogenase [Priestia filamentosa]OXS65373.1 D-glycerate dehydrogenase [Priestia filamentosa]SMF68415.1 glyoxylate reductase [Priestia filamentosa]
MGEYKIVVTRKIPDESLDMMKKYGELYIWPEEEIAMPYERLKEEIRNAHALYTNVGDKIDRELLESAPHLKVISTMAVGFDNIDMEYAREQGVAVGHTPSVLNETTADLAFTLLMAAGRRIVEGAGYIKEEKWKSWGPMLLTGQDIYGARLGIIGMGRIGEGVARRALGFNMDVVYYNRNQKPHIEEEMGVTYCELTELLQTSDFIVLLAPGSEETRHMIGTEQFQLMKESAVFINVSRGTNVDEQALYKALKEGEIWAAGLDVFEEEPISASHPLLSLPNVTAVPHIGSASIATRKKMAMMAAENLVAGIKGEKLPFEVQA